MGMLFLTPDTQDIIDRLNRVFRKAKIHKMRRKDRAEKFSTDPVKGRTLARCAKTFKLHPRKENYHKPALRWFWLLRYWGTVQQVDPDNAGQQVKMADAIKRWIYEGLTLENATGGGGYVYEAICFTTQPFAGSPNAAVQRDVYTSTGKIMVITAYTTEVESGVENREGFNIPPGPDPNENPPDVEDPVDDGTKALGGKKTVAKKKAAKKKAAKKKVSNKKPE